ncbi:glucosamine-6-phosphate deaminase [Patescibacteria group bacterium]
MVKKSDLGKPKHPKGKKTLLHLKDDGLASTIAPSLAGLVSEGLQTTSKNDQFREINHPEIKKILVYPDAQKAAFAAAHFIADCVLNNPQAAISYATGNSKVLVYQKVAQLITEGKVDFSQTKAFHLDEYYPCDPKADHSFVAYLNRLVFGPFRIKPENAYPMNGLAPDPDREAARYDRLLKKNPVDLVILGIGPKGHIAFNESGTLFNRRTHVIRLAPETIRRDRWERGQDSPHHAITQGVKNILEAEKILMIAYGSVYNSRLKLALKGPIGVACSASALREQGQKTTFIIDEAAAQGLG